MKKRRATRACTRDYNKKLNQLVSCKRSQVTIFIIIALLLVGIIIFFFMFRGKIPIIEETKQIEKNPQIFLDSEIEPQVKEAVDLLGAQGGYIIPLNYYLINNERISYLCYTQEDNRACVNQEPMLIQHLKDEIKTYIQEDVEKAFEKMKKSLEAKAYNVEMRGLEFKVNLLPGKIIIDMKRTIELTKSGETLKHEQFKSIIPSKFYDIAVVVQEILSQEARFCNFEQVGFMSNYPDFNIDKFKTWDSTIIYTVEHRDSKEKFKFAVRGCVIPPEM